MSTKRLDLPKITDAILNQWEASAAADLEAERSWSVHPLAVLAVVTELRAVHKLIAHARLISPSERAVIYVADLENALGIDAPVPHKLGGGG